MKLETMSIRIEESVVPIQPQVYFIVIWKTRTDKSSHVFFSHTNIPKVTNKPGWQAIRIINPVSISETISSSTNFIIVLIARDLGPKLLVYRVHKRSTKNRRATPLA